MKENPEAVPDRMAGRAVRGLGLVSGLGLFVLGLVVVGKLTRDGLREEDRYTLSFGDIDCPAPPGRDRADFLAEVQYLSEAPGRLRLLDEGLASRLAEAFVRHPWVEGVQRVEVRPPRRVEVRLVYRTPVLEVVPPGPADGVAGQSGYRVDGRGILLGGRGEAAGVPVFEAGARPAGAAGSRYGEPAVEAAARTAGLLLPYQGRLGVKRLEGTADRLVLRGEWPGAVVWGRAPGDESPGEAAAAEKLQRLLRYCGGEGEESSWVSSPIDLRSSN